MSDEDTTNELNSFTITVERTFEEDIHDNHVESILEKVEGDNPEDAIAQMIGQKEAENISPTQKLLSINVDVQGPDDD